MSDAGVDDEDNVAQIEGDESGSSWNIVPSMDEQSQVASSLINSMAASNLTQTPSLPTDGAPAGGQQSPVAGLLAKLTQDTGNSANAKSNQSIVTRAIANQGQLLPIGAGASSSGSNSPASQGDLQKVLAAIQASNQSTQSSEASTAASTKSSSSSGGGVLGDIGSVVGAVASWIICTELVRQGKMPLKWYIVGGSVFAAYPEVGKRGYYIWAIPCVKHLRKYPNDRFSKFLELIFLWRAENIAAHRGVKGARKLLRGTVVTAILYPVCRFLGFILWLCGKDFDWMQLYGERV